MKIVITGANRGIVAESSSGIIRTIDQLTLQASGGFFGFQGERLPW